jgi:hypothetical protein
MEMQGEHAGGTTGGRIEGKKSIRLLRSFHYTLGATKSLNFGIGIRQCMYLKLSTSV